MDTQAIEVVTFDFKGTVNVLKLRTLKNNYFSRCS